MKIAEMVHFGREMLKAMSENDVKVSDWKYVPMYDEYRHMRSKGMKYRYVIAHLAMIYHISKSKVERIIRRLGKDVK
jgi:hypothetical protein